MKIWKEWPVLIKVQEIILILAMIIYLIAILNGGSFTAYYATMVLLVIGVVTAAIALIKKQYLLVGFNLLLPLLAFLYYLSVA